MATDLLHLLQNPSAFLGRCGPLLSDHGALVLGGPNFDCLPVFVRRVWRSKNYRKLQAFDLGGVHVFSVIQLRCWLRGSGLEPDSIIWRNAESDIPLSGSAQPRRWPGRFLAGVWHGLAGPIKGRSGPGRFAARAWMARARRLPHLPAEPLAEVAKLAEAGSNRA